MSEFWTIGPAAAAYRLRLCGFSPLEAERLVVLKIRYDRGELRQSTEDDRLPEPTEDDRLGFARWLVEHGRLSD
jgi:hypothetical protein